MDRSKGIGGTDIAAIIGLNPWKSAIDVYMEKLGLVEPQEDNENLWWGREMEPVLQKRYEKESKYRPLSCDMMQDSQYPWIVGSPDGLIFTGGLPFIDDKGFDLGLKSTATGNLEGGVDYKTTGYSHLSDWGEAGTDEVPPYYHIQATWYMGLTGAQWWDLAVLFMGARREFRIYRISRDDDLIATLIEKGREFWENHVIPQVPPPVDASPGWNEYFKKRFPKDEEPLIQVEVDSSIDVLVCLIKKYKVEAKEIDDRWAEVENKLKAKIGDHAGVEGEFGKITWRKSKDRTVVDWEKVFNYLWENYVDQVNEDRWESKKEILDKFTATKPGPRVFKTYFKGE